MKYQNEGGPDLARCFELLRRVTRPSAPCGQQGAFFG